MIIGFGNDFQALIFVENPTTCAYPSAGDDAITSNRGRLLEEVEGAVFDDVQMSRCLRLFWTLVQVLSSSKESGSSFTSHFWSFTRVILAPEMPATLPGSVDTLGPILYEASNRCTLSRV